MAKTPRFFTSPGSAPQLNVGGGMDPALTGSMVTSGVEGQAEQQLASDMDKFIQQDLEKQNNAYLRTDLAAFQLQAIQEYETQKKSLADNPQGFSSRFQNWFTQSSKNILESAPSEEARNIMTSRLGGLQAQYLKQGIGEERRALTQHRLLKTDQVANSLINRLATNPEELDIVNSQINNLFDGMAIEGIDANTINATREKAMKQSRIAQAEGFMRQDPQIVLDKVLSGDYNDLSFSSVNSLYKRSLNGVASNLKEMHKVEEQRALKNLYYNSSSLDPQNPDYKKAADLAFDDLLSSMLDENGQITASNEEYIGSILDFAKEGKGLIAPKLKSLIEGNVVNGSPQNKKLYSQLLRALDEDPKTRPVISQFNDATINEAFLITRLTDSGTPIEEAVDMARQQIREPRNDLIQARREQIRTDRLLSRENVMTELEDKYDNVHNIDRASASYRNIFQDTFEKTGDPDLARDIALRKLDTTFGVTEINGTEELMENPPEKLFPGQVDDFKKGLTDVLVKELGAEITEPGLLDSVFGDEEIKVKIDGEERKIEVSSLPTTPKDLGYKVTYKETLADGTLVDTPVINPNSGLPIKYIYIPGKAEPTDQDIKQMNKLREIREQQNRQVKELKDSALSEATKLERARREAEENVTGEDPSIFDRLVDYGGDLVEETKATISKWFD